MTVVHTNSTLSPFLRKVTTIFACLALFIWLTTTLGFHGSKNTTNNKDSKLHRYAFATILMTENDPEFPDVEEPYLEAARLLTFQLLRNPRTRSRIDHVPFIVLVTPNIPERHRNILSREGATVVPVESLDHDWPSADSQRSDGSIVKLNLWKLEEYDKVLFLNVTSVLFHPLDEIFENPVTAIRASTNPTAEMPKNYMIAAPQDPSMRLNTQLVLGNKFHQNSKMDDGFFVLHPSKGLYNYYTSLLRLLEKHDSSGPEQNLLNQAHRKDGPMPWQDLGFGGNSKHASQSDYERGLKSVDHEWWRPIADEFIGDRIAMAIDERLAYLNH